MSQEAKKSLGVPDGKASGSKRKMTHQIIDENDKEGDVYQFLEEDDDFEEFEDNFDGEEVPHIDMAAGGEIEKTLWQQDWDDEEVDEDFGAKLRAQLAK